MSIQPMHVADVAIASELDYGFYDAHFQVPLTPGAVQSDFAVVTDGRPEWKVTARSDRSDKEPTLPSSPTLEHLLKTWPGNQLSSASSLSPSPLLPIISRYQDLVYTCRSHGRDDAVSDAYLIHVANHLLYGISKVEQGDELVAKHPDAEVRDQGFTQPKVLIMCPFKSSAFDVINRLLHLLPRKYSRQVSNRNRFDEEFGPPTLEQDDLDRYTSKPELYRSVFHGNFDDNFRIGIKLGRRSAKLYSEFYSSDIIITSPLGLRMITGAEGDKPSAREFDFLSSLEIVVLDQADVFTMQNWEHVLTVLDCCNRIPNDGSHTDFSRVRHSHLDGLSARYRQTMVFASHCVPEINSLAAKYCRSASGTVKVRRKQFGGVLEHVVRPVRQHFQRFDPGSSTTDAAEARFKLFSNVLLPQLKYDASSQILIFVPSYFDYVRVRNLFRCQQLKAALCSEYSKKGSVARARTRFFHGQQKFLICTERFHFFRRYCIRGAHTVVFYSLPQEPEFYVDFLHAIEADTQQSSITLFSRFDFLALERIVGSTRAVRLITADKDLHMFC